MLCIFCDFEIPSENYAQLFTMYFKITYARLYYIK